MFYSYYTSSKYQEDSNISSLQFCKKYTKKQPNKLNYQKRREDFMWFAKNLLPKSKSVVCESLLYYVIYKSDNLSGLLWHSQASMAKFARCSERQVRRILRLFEKHKIIFVKRRGRNVTNAYEVNYSLLDSNKSNYEVRNPLLETYPHEARKYRNSRIKRDRTSSVRQSTYIDKEVSINTLDPSLEILSKEDEFLKPDLDVQTWQPKEITKRNLIKKLNIYDDDFLKDCLSSFRLTIKLNTLSNDELNRLFYKHCVDTFYQKQRYGDQWIPFYNRLIFKEYSMKNKPPSPVPPPTNNSHFKPYYEYIKHSPKQERYVWTTEEEQEAEMQLQEFFKKIKEENKNER